MGTLAGWLGRRGVESMTIYLSSLGIAICVVVLARKGAGALALRRAD
jgi:hypothetical protein